MRNQIRSRQNKCVAADVLMMMYGKPSLYRGALLGADKTNY
jgi:hypothetical protein